MRRILRIAISGSVIPPTTITVPVISVATSYLPRNEWCDQSGDPMEWVDGSPACWQESGIIPVIISQRLTSPTISAGVSVYGPAVRGTKAIAAPVISASGSAIPPGIVAPAAILSVPTISASGSAIPPGIVAPAAILSVPTITASGSAEPPGIAGSVTLTAPVISASGSANAPALGLEGSLIAGMIFAGANVIPPEIGGQISIAVPVIHVGAAVIAPEIGISAGFDYDLVADRQTFTLAADHAATYHINLKTIGLTAPRRPTRPRSILL